VRTPRAGSLFRCAAGRAASEVEAGDVVVAGTFEPEDGAADGPVEVVPVLAFAVAPERKP
jgi:hypothetical protein